MGFGRHQFYLMPFFLILIADWIIILVPQPQKIPAENGLHLTPSHLRTASVAVGIGHSALVFHVSPWIASSGPYGLGERADSEEQSRLFLFFFPHFPKPQLYFSGRPLEAQHVPFLRWLDDFSLLLRKDRQVVGDDRRVDVLEE